MLCIGAASAADDSAMVNQNNGDTLGVSENTGGAELLGTSSEGNNLLSASSGTFSDLNTTISHIVENESYIFDSSIDTYVFNGDRDGAFINGVVISQNNVTIDGNSITIDGNNLARIFTITGNNVTLKNFNFINGNATGTNYGGAIYWTGDNATIESTTFSHNTVEKYGSAIYYAGEDLTLKDVIFDENKGGAALSIDVYDYDDIVAHVKGLNSFFNAIYITGIGTLKYDNVRYWDEKQNKIVDRSSNVIIWSGQTTNLPRVEVTLSILDKNGVEILSFTNTTDDNGDAYFDFSDYYSSGELSLGHRFIGNKYYHPTNQDIFQYGGGGEFQELYKYIANEVRKGNKNIALNKTVTYTIGKDAMTKGIPIKWDGITIDGKGHIIDAQNIASIFEITGSNVTIKNINFVNGYTEIRLYGGAITVDNTNTSIKNCTFDNFTGVEGGAIYITSLGSNPSIEDSNFTNCIATQGGAIMVRGSNSSISNSLFKNNSAILNYSVNVNGGAIAFTSTSGTSYATVDHCNFINNTATNNGGAIHNGMPNVYIYYSNFVNNNATTGGALNSNRVIYVHNSYLDNNSATNGGALSVQTNGHVKYVYDSIFNNNVASNNGGAIWCKDTTNNQLFVERSNFTNNSAGHDGGAIKTAERYGSIKYSNFINNTAVNNGGAIHFVMRDSHIDYSNFTNNTATNGGALYIYSGSTAVSITGINFINNTATNNGGAVYTSLSSNHRLTFNNFNFTNNTAMGYGGAVYTSGTGSYNLNVINFTHNRAGSHWVISENDDGDLVGQLIGNNRYYNAIYAQTDRAFMISGSVWYWNETTGYTNVKPTLNFNSIQTLPNESVIITQTNGESTSGITNATGQVIYSPTSKDFVKYSFYFDGNEAYLPSSDSGNAVGYGGEFYHLQNDLNKKASQLTDDNRIIYLDKNYTYTLEWDTITEGVNINVDNVIIDGQGHTIDAQGMSRIFRVLAENVTLHNISFVNASSTHGAAVYWTGLGGNISNCNFTNNTITGSGNNGGSIFADAQGLIIEHSTFKNNTGCTPGILVNKANVKINDCEFTNNTITGGANYYLNSIVSYSSTGTYGLVNNSRFYNNTGRGIYASTGANGLEIRNSNFTNNTLPSNIAHHGGAVTVTGTDLIIDNCNFTNNTVLASNQNGGALYINGNGAHVSNSNFKDNTASNNGGAYYVDAANHVLENCIFNNNYGLNNGNDSVYVNGKNFQLKNNIISNLILDFGTITTTTHIVVLDNGPVKGSIFEPVNVTAVITDDNNNVIYVDDLQFISENCTQIGSVIFDKETGIYSAGLLFNTTGTYNVGVSSNRLSDIAVKSGTVIIDPNTVVITILDNTTVKGSIFVPVNITAVVTDKDGVPISLPGFMFVLPDGTNVEPDSFNSTTGTYTLSYLFDTLGEYTISANTTLLNYCEINNCIVNITSDKATICILDNGTAYANLRDSFVINATMVDEYGNSVENYTGLKFVLPDGSTVNAKYDSNTGLYSGRYLFDTYGYFSIGAMIDGSASLSVLNGTVVNSAPGSIIVDDINYTETANINITLGGRSHEKMINFEATTGTATVKITGDNGYEMTEELDLGSFEKLTYVSPVLDKNGNNITLPSGVSHVLNVAGLNVGNYTVFVHFTGDSKVPPMEFSTSFKVIKLDSLVNASVDNITYGDVAVIKDNLVNPSEIVTVIISNGTYSGEFKGIGEISISDLEAGNYSVIISYPGDNIYNANNITLLLTVDPADADLNIGLDNDTVDIGGEAILNIALTPGLNTTVIVNVDGTNYTVNLVNGKGTLNLTEKGITSKFGVYTINATLTDIQNFKGNTTTNNITLTVNKINTDLILLKK